MPTLKFYGDRLDVGSVGDRQVVANPTSKQARPPIEPAQFTRNGMYPQSALLNMLNEAANQSVLYRTKEVARFVGRIGASGFLLSGGAGDRPRWRFTFKSSAYAHALCCAVVMGPPDGGTTSNSSVRVDISTNTTGLTPSLSQTFSYGASPTGSASAAGWRFMKPILSYIDGIAANTTYYGTISDVDAGRIQSISVFELASMTEGASGYLPINLTMHSAITDVYRKNLVTVMNSLMQTAGATVFNFSVDDGAVPIVGADATARNILDTSVTAVAASSPGWTFDMTGKDRLASGGVVPCVFAAFGGCAGFNSGAVYLKDSAGSMLATLGSWTPGSPYWQQATVNLPASVDKYDLMLDDGTGLLGGGPPDFNLYAATMYELG